MSLGIVVKGPEGIVLAADSRVTLTEAKRQLRFNFDNATKLLTFGGDKHQWIAGVTYGDAVMGTQASDLRTAPSFLPEFEVSLPNERLSVQDFAQRFSDFFLKQWQKVMPSPYTGSGMTFVLGGFNENEPYGSMYLLNIPHQPIPVEQSPNSFGITGGGQTEHTTRLLTGYDPQVLALTKQALNLSDQQIETLRQALTPLRMPIPYQILPLQDCIDLAIFLIKTTIAAQKLSTGVRGVGGAIDVAVITRHAGVRIIQRKALVGETSTQQ